MKIQVTAHNIQVTAANTAENTDKTEFTNFFGISPSTVRRILTGAALAVVTVTTIQPAEAAWTNEDLAAVQNYIRAHPGMPEYIINEITNSDSLQQANYQLHGNSYWDGQKLIFTPPISSVVTVAATTLTPAKPNNVVTEPPKDAIPTKPLTPELPQNTTVVPALNPVRTMLTPQAIPQATPQKTPVAPVHTVQLTPQAIPQATPQKTPVTPVHTVQLTPQAIPQATPQKTPVTPVHVTQLTPQAIPQATPQKTPVAPVHTVQLTPQAIPQATPQKTPVAPVHVVQLTPQAIPQATPQKTPVAPVHTVQLTPQAIPQAIPQKTPVAPVHVVQLTPQAIPQATPQKTPVAPVHTVQLTPQTIPQAIPQKTSSLAFNDTPSKTVTQTTSTPVQQTIIQQQVRSAYYDNQIIALNTQAEENQAEILSESHSRAAGDANTLNQANDYTNNKFSDLKNQIDDNKDEANAGTASALAAVGIPQVETGSDFMVGAGAGTYGNQSAIAVGVSGHLTAKTVTKLAITGDTNNGFGASAGVGWNF